VFTDPH
jgi:ribonuclease HI